MKPGRSTKLLIEPPSSATGDIAFNLIVFFLVCASVQPDSGRKQSIPRSEQQEQKTEDTKHIEVLLTRTTAAINGNPVPLPRFAAQMRKALQGKTRPEDRVVVIRSKPDTPYQHWIEVTGMIEDAGGMITIQLEEEREVIVP